MSGKYTNGQVEAARAANRWIERDWDKREKEGKLPASRAEDAYRQGKKERHQD